MEKTVNLKTTTIKIKRARRRDHRRAVAGCATKGTKPFSRTRGEEGTGGKGKEKGKTPPISGKNQGPFAKQGLFTGLPLVMNYAAILV